MYHTSVFTKAYKRLGFEFNSSKAKVLYQSPSSLLCIAASSIRGWAEKFIGWNKIKLYLLFMTFLSMGSKLYNIHGRSVKTTNGTMLKKIPYLVTSSKRILVSL